MGRSRVLTTEWLFPTGRWRTIALRAKDSPEKMLRQALFNYLKKHRAGVDDSIFSRLLEAAASGGEEFSRKLAGWNKLTLAQLAQVSGHDASPWGARKLRRDGPIDAWACSGSKARWSW